MDDRRQGSAVPSADGDKQQQRNYNLIRCLPWLLMLALLWKAQQMQRTAQPSQLIANVWDAQHGAKSPASAVKLDWCSCPGIVQAPTLRQDPAALQLYQQMAEEVRAADQAQALLSSSVYILSCLLSTFTLSCTWHSSIHCSSSGRGCALHWRLHLRVLAGHSAWRPHRQVHRRA